LRIKKTLQKMNNSRLLVIPKWWLISHGNPEKLDMDIKDKRIVLKPAEETIIGGDIPTMAEG